MTSRITADLDLNGIESLIKDKASSCEFWGNLDLTIEEFDILGDAIRSALSRSLSGIELICKSYPHCMTTYMVFFAVYKFDYNFWGALADDLNTPIPQPQQESLGYCARKMFGRYSMDYSEAKDEARKNIAPIIYEACIPPDSSLDDLFYVLSYDSYHAFDPQLIIDDLIEMRSYAIRKPLLRFLSRFKNDRAIDYLLEVYDAIISAEQKSSIHSRYTDSYCEWKEKEKSKSGISSRKDKEHQTRPYLFFDEGRNGLSLMLPRIILESEWIDTAKWIVTSKNGFSRSVECKVFGDEGRRFTDVLSIPVPPVDMYTVKLQDSELFDDKPMKQWEVFGIPSDKPVWFNNNGRQVNANYILNPYGVLILPSAIQLSTKEVSIEEQYYPNKTNSYRIVSITPLGSNAQIEFDCQGKHFELLSRPQINMELIGKHLLGVKGSNLFTEIPQLVIEVEGSVNKDSLELHIGNSIYPVILSGENATINLIECSNGELNKYGTYSVRLYQRGRFMKQVEFNYVPAVQSNYSSTLFWPPDRKKLSDVKTLRFKRLKDWEMVFEGCDVNCDEENYMVDVPSSVGSISVDFQSMADDFAFRCSFELPVNPFEYDILSLQGDVIEKTSKIHKTDLKSLTESELWFSLRTYGEFTDKEYKLALRTVNGLEQEETIKLNNKGSGNLNLSAFYDTIRNSPLPLEIVLICEDNLDNAISIIYVSEANSFTLPVTSTRNRKCVRISAEDENKDLDVLRFGYNRNTVHLDYDSSKISEDGIYRGYPFPSGLTEGIYIVSGEKKESIFDIEDDSFSFDILNNILYVSCQQEDNKITSKNLLNHLFYDVLHISVGDELKEALSYRILTNLSKLKQIEIVQMDYTDIERLVALAYIYNGKIEKQKKKLLSQMMRCISVSLMKRGDRYRIIELLTELDAPQEVFDTCLKEYSLLLVYSDNPERQILAGKVEKYSPELSMILMMSTDGPIRDCMWKEKYIEIIGRDAIKHLLQVPYADSVEEANSEIKGFLREEMDNGVEVTLDDQIAGNVAVIQGMIGLDKWNNPTFDISKKPEYGIYFGRIKYVDQYVNWYKNTHDKNQEMYPELKQMKEDVVNQYGDKLLECIKELNNNRELKRLTNHYMRGIEGRIDSNISKYSYAWFFYLQGIAAFLARLPVGNPEYDKIRVIGIKFMSVASVIAPKLSQRDILMAQVFIYLERKEESLCP